MDRGKKGIEEASSSNSSAISEAEFAKLSLSWTRSPLLVAGSWRSAAPPGFNPMSGNNYNANRNLFAYGNAAGENEVEIGWRKPLQVFPEFRTRVVEVAMTASGAAFLRRALDLGQRVDVEGVLREVVESPWLLMKNRHGSCFFQRLVEVCSCEMRTVLLRRVVGDLLELFGVCSSQYGKDSIQSLVRRCNTREQHLMLARAFIRPNFLQLVSDTHGSHVACLLLKVLPYPFIKPAFALIAFNLRELATDRSGCCVLQKCVAEYAQDEERIQLINLVIYHAMELAQDDYGNYVLQNVLEIPGVADLITDKFEGSFASLATQKCSSNVVEKCILMCGYSQFIDVIATELLCSPRKLEIFQDPYGNYVVQRMLSKAKDKDFEIMATFILSYQTSLSSNLYARNILKNIEKRKAKKHNAPYGKYGDF